MSDSADLAYLQSLRAVRERAEEVLQLAVANKLEHFSLDESRLPSVVRRVIAVTERAYPDRTLIPYHSRWRHFSPGMDRVAALRERVAASHSRPLTIEDWLRVQFDLLVPSVLLDAGSGDPWIYREPDTHLTFARSEGLGIASFHLFREGALSAAPAEEPLRADAEALISFSEEALARAFQVNEKNPLRGLPGRVHLLRRLGEAAGGASPWFKGPEHPGRVGNLGVNLYRAADRGRLPAEVVFTAVLQSMGSIWPSRHRLHGTNLGDVWPHPQLGWVPFHKLSQWLTYSMIEPLEEAGIVVTGLDALTGLAEYRNGGLFVDAGVLVPKSASAFAFVHSVSSPLVVEWRALTVALLDRTAEGMREALGLTADQLPLAKVLEGGTWSAGREIARENRQGGPPPFTIESDGTVF